MVLWIGILALLLVVAGGLSLALFWKRAASADRRDHLLEVYRAQLDEVERDLKRGLIDETAAEAARTEIARRILRLEEEGGEQAATGGSRQRMFAPLLGIAVAGAALGLYLLLGSPDTPGIPYAEREAERRLAEQEREAQAPIVEARRAIERELEENPEDAGAWARLGQIQIQLGEPGRAMSSLRRATALAPDEAEFHAALGEALLLAGGLQALPEAREALNRALEIDAGNPRAAFFLAMTLVEEGRLEEGYESLIALLRRAPPGASWQTAVRATAQDLAAELGVAFPDELAAPAAPPMAGGLDSMSEEQRAMVGQMVEGLAARLAEEPGDLEGWQRLARSYQVMGEADGAAGALTQVARLQPGVAQAQLDAAIAHVEAARSRGEALPPEAEPLFERTLALQPDSIDARFFLGEYAFKRGETETARDYWEPLLDQLPADSDIGAFLRRRMEALDG